MNKKIVYSTIDQLEHINTVFTEMRMLYTCIFNSQLEKAKFCLSLVEQVYLSFPRQIHHESDMNMTTDIVINKRGSVESWYLQKDKVSGGSRDQQPVMKQGKV